MASSNLIKLKLLLPSHPTIHYSHLLLPHSSPFFPSRRKLLRRHLLAAASARSGSSRPLILCSASSSYKPPSSRTEAISEAKLCLSTTLQKSLNNSLPLPTRKLKKLRHPRYRVEIPVVDDSPASLAQLAFDVFSDLPLRKKGPKPRLLIMWPSTAAVESARQAFGSMESVVNSDWASVTPESLSSADLVVFLSPEVSQLEDLKRVTNTLYPKPSVLFNPNWGFEEEKDFDSDSESFVNSFDVVYSFMGLEVRGVLSKRKGVVFKCARDGVVSGEGWVVMVEEEGNNKEEMKMVTSFKRRPTISEVENVLYNLMAANSPVTKSVKFITDLVSNVTGKKARNSKDHKGVKFLWLLQFSKTLKKLSTGLEHWSKHGLGSLEKNLNAILQEIEVLEAVEANSQCNEQDELRLRYLVNKAMALNRQIHVKWWSKARSSWLEQNDKNNKYFHNLVKFKRMKNCILEIDMDDTSINQPKDIAAAFANWYKVLWEREETLNSGWHLLDGLDWKQIPNCKLTELTKDFSTQV